MYSLIFEAIGTRWEISIASLLPVNKKVAVDKLIRKRIEDFDKTYSRFRGDSFVRRMAVNKGMYVLPDDSRPLFELYFALYKLTEGLFTPLIGQVLDDAGYDETYSLKPKVLHSPRSWEEAFSIDDSCITVKYPILLDFGAAGKGYLLDLVSNLLRENGIDSYCVEAGGDICNYNNEDKNFRVGLENPNDFSQVIGVAIIGNESICGSAGNRRKWGKYHHIIDPNTLSSPQSVAATWVVAETTMLADGLSTCLFFVSPEILLKRYQFEYVVLYSDFSIKKSGGFRGELFINNL